MLGRAVEEFPAAQPRVDDFALGELGVTFRDRRTDDDNFIYQSWLLTHRQTGDWPRRVSSRTYFDRHKLVLAAMLARSKVIIACNSAVPSQIMGYIVYEPPSLLHWFMVKHIFRGAGLGRELYARARLTAPVVCSHWTFAAMRLRAQGWPLVYDPYLYEKDDKEIPARDLYRPGEERTT